MKLGNITKARWYDDACATAHALDLLGERWAMLVVRELMLGPRRFSDIRAGLPGISANVLTQRLDGLEAAGVVTRRKLPPPAGVQVYELTPWGYEAEPIFQTMGRWAARSPSHDPTRPFSAASLMLSFRTMFQPTRAVGSSIRIGFRIAGETYRVVVADGRITAERAPLGHTDATVEGDAALVAGIVYGGVPLNGLEATALKIEGHRPTFERFIGLFPLPPKVATAA